MDGGWALVVAAVVTAVGGIIVAVLQQFKKENSKDHAYVRGMLTMLYSSQRRIEGKVEKVDDRLSDHLEFHASGKVLDNGGAIQQDGVEATGRLSS